MNATGRAAPAAAGPQAYSVLDVNGDQLAVLDRQSDADGSVARERVLYDVSSQPVVQWRPALIRVRVLGGDPVTQAGVASLLDVARDLRASTDEDEPTDIAVVVVNSLTPPALTLVRQLGADPAQRLVLVLGELSQEGLAVVLQAGAVGLIRRRDATAGSLCQLIRSVVAGDVVVPADLVSALHLNRPNRPREMAGQPVPVPRLLAMACASDRELAVLSMLSEGADTREISRRMSYSERTVKTIIQDVIRRFGLRNRAHAVGYAVRRGLI